MRGHFAWEYKGKHKDLNAAYQQLLQYREALENPPLLVVSDFERFEIHTNFTNTPKQVYRFTLAELDRAENLAILRALFTEPERLRPARTVESVTEEAAARFARLALALQDRGVEPHQAAHFLVQVLFCLFAEDVGLLPNKVFSRLLEFARRRPGVPACETPVRLSGSLSSRRGASPEDDHDARDPRRRDRRGGARPLPGG